MIKQAATLVLFGMVLTATAFGAGWQDRTAITDLEIAARVQGEEFSFDLSCTASGHRIGAEIPLVSGNVSLTGVPQGAGWHLRYDAAKKSYLVVLDKGSTGTTIKASFVAKSEKDPTTPNWRAVMFNVPGGRVRRVRIDADRKDLELKLPGTVQIEREEQGEKLLVTGTLALDKPFTARWQVKVPKIEAKLLVASEANTIVTISQGALVLDTLFNYEISQGKLQELRFGIPPKLNVTQVRGDHVQDWHLTEADAARSLVVRLNRKLEKQYRLQVLGEMALERFPTDLELPVVQPLDGTRADGFLALGTNSAIQLQIKQSTGLSQIDPTAFPRASLSKDQPRTPPKTKAFYYAFAATPYQAEVSLADIVPTYDTEHRLVAAVKDDDLTVDGELELEVRDAPIRRLHVDLPPGFIVANLTGGQVADHSVKDVRGEDGGSRELLVEFKAPVMGRVLIQFRLEMGKSPLGATQELSNLSVRGSRNERGFIAVTSDAGVHIDAPETTGLRQVHTRSVPMRVADAQFAWRFREAGWVLRLPVEERPASIRAETFHLLSLGDGIAYGSVTVTYFISGAPVDELSFSIPDELGNVEFIGLDVSRWYQRDGLWTVKLARKVVGDYNLGITYTQRFEDGGTALAGGINCANVETETGFITVASHLDVRVSESASDPALIPIGDEETPAQYRLLVSSPTLSSYKYVRSPHELQVQVNAYARGATPTVMVEFTSADTYLSLDEKGHAESVTRVRYTVKNSSAQFLNLTVPKALKVWGTRIVEKTPQGGERTTRVSAATDNDTLKIPLKRQRNPNAPITVEVEYGQVHGKLGWTGGLALQLPPCLVRSTYADWRLRVPEGWVLRPGGRGSMGAAQASGSFFTRFTARIVEAWVEVFTFGPPLVCLLVALGFVVVALLFPRRWLGRIAVLLFGVALLIQGIVACREAGRVWQQRMHSNTLTFTQVLDLDEAAAMSASVSAAPLWREHMSLSVVFLLGVLAVIAVVRGMRLPRGRTWLFAVAAAAVLGISLQFEAGARIAQHALTWGLAVLLWVPLLLRRGAGVAPRRSAAGTAALLAVLAFGVAGTTEVSAKTAAKRRAAPPLVFGRDTHIERVEVTVNVKKNSLLTDLKLDVDTEKSLLLPIAPASAMLLAAPTDPGIQLTTEAGSYVLGIPPGKHQLAVQVLFPLPERKEDDTDPRTFSMPMPPALTNRVQFIFPEKGWEVEAPEAVFLKRTETETRTEVAAVLQPHRDLTFTWKPRGRITKLEETVFYAEIVSLGRADSGLIECMHAARLRVAQGELSRVVFRIPEDMTVTRVEGEKIGNWRFDPVEHALYVGMDQPITADYEMAVMTQITAKSMPYQARIRPLVVDEASRQHGVLGVLASSLVTLTVQDHPQPMNIDDFKRQASKLLARIDAKKHTDVLHAYRVAAPDAAVGVDVVAVTPELRTDESATFDVADERLVFNTTVNTEIAKAGVFWIDIELPEGYDVDSLTCDALSHWDELEEGGQRLARIHFKKQLLGATAVNLALSRAVNELPRDIPVPRTAVRDVLKHRGQLIITAERGVRLGVATREGVSELDVARLRQQRKPALAFKMLRAEWTLTLQSEVIAPRISVDFLHLAEVSDGLVRHRHYLRYRFQNAGAKTFNLTVAPDALGLLINGPEIARKELVDPEQGLWRVELTGKWFDRPYPLEVSYETRFSQDEGRVPIGPLTAVEADLQRGYVVVRTTARVELATVSVSPSLQPAEARSVPTKFGAGELADAAFCYTSPSADYALELDASRHEAAATLRAEVVKANLTTVVSRQRDTIHEVKLTLRAGGKRHLHAQLPANSNIWSLLVDRQSRTPSFTDDDSGGRSLLIPLPQSTGAELTVDVDLIYVIPRARRASMRRHEYEGPRFDLPLRNISWAFYVPKEFTYHDFDGTLSADEKWTDQVQVSRYDINAYEAENRRVMAADLQKAVELQKQGMQLARKGQQKAARQAFSQAFNYSVSDKSLNEDARVNLRRLLKQQAVVGLVGRRNDVRQVEQAQTTQQVPVQTLGENFTQEQAERLQGSLSKTDSDNLERITNRIIDIQEAAARTTLQLEVKPPLHGRVLLFRRPLQVERNAAMRVQFRARPVPARRTAQAAAWAVGLALFLTLLFGAAPVAGRTWTRLMTRPRRERKPKPAAQEQQAEVATDSGPAATDMAEDETPAGEPAPVADEEAAAEADQGGEDTAPAAEPDQASEDEDAEPGAAAPK